MNSKLFKEKTKMIDVTKDQTVETQDNDLIELFIEDNEVVLMLAECAYSKEEVDYLAIRHLTITQIDALIKALEIAKADLQ
jgi:hypothetical protein